MSVGQIAVRYARALFRIAREKKELDAVRNDMELLMSSVSAVPDLQILLDSPIVDSGKKASILTEVFRSGMSELGLDFIRLACSNKREEYLPGMARYFISLYKKEKGIMIARISSAVEMDQNSSDFIKDQVKQAFKSEIELENEIREDLIGGFVLTVEDKQLDASVKGKLARIKKELLN